MKVKMEGPSIIRGDKGRSTVVMNREDYNEKAKAQLEDREFYRPAQDAQAKSVAGLLGGSITLSSQTELPNQIEFRGSCEDGSTVDVVFSDKDTAGQRNTTKPFELYLHRTGVQACEFRSTYEFIAERATLQVAWYDTILAASARIYSANRMLSTTESVYEFIQGDSLQFEVIPFTGTIQRVQLLIVAETSDELVLETSFSQVSERNAFEEVGSYKATFLLTNEVSLLPIVRQFRILPAVRGLQIIRLIPDLVPGEWAWLAITFIQLADEACVCLEKGNGERLFYPALGQVNPSCPACPQYLPEDGRPLQGDIKFPVFYPRPGIYNLTATVSFMQWTQAVSLSVLVSNEPQLLPGAEFEDPRGTNALQPAAFFSVDGYTLTVRLNLSASTRTANVDGSSIALVWQAWLLQPESLIQDEVIYSAEQALPPGAVLQHSLPPGLLAPGVYRMDLKGQPFGSPTLASTFLVVRPSPLVIRLWPGNERRITVGTEEPQICLSPRNYSFDPNRGTSTTGRVIENWRLNCSHRSLAVRENTWADCEIPNLINDDSGHFCFLTQHLTTHHLYTFYATGSSQDQVGTGYLEVMKISADAPRLRIVPVKPALTFDSIDSMRSWVSVTDDLALQGICEASSQCRAPYSWTLLEQHPNGTERTLAEEEAAQAVKDITARTLVIRSAFMQTIHSGAYLGVCFSMSVDEGVAAVCRQFKPVAAPTADNCHTNATTEVTFNDMVCVWCEEQEPQTSPNFYRFSVVDGEEVVLLTSAYSSKFCGRLPFRRKPYSVCVRVVNRFAAYTESCFHGIQVQPFDEETAQHELQLIAAGSMEAVLASGSMTDVAPVVQTLSATIAELSIGEVLTKLVTALNTTNSFMSTSLLHTASNLLAISQCSKDLPVTALLTLYGILEVTVSTFPALTTYATLEDSILAVRALSVSSLNLIEVCAVDFHTQEIPCTLQETPYYPKISPCCVPQSLTVVTERLLLRRR
ncbi:unnamed protein product [Schistocephalus solidus]|uniref:REJ domain-containing protein n=1 Tax=Schistocephalus solidus TaxID=70667 RepID=A0A183SUS4_SCHSO|nr:unnamed protein product [Schistocephalus solidus]